MRTEQRDAEGMIQYYWSAIVGTERTLTGGAHRVRRPRGEVGRDRVRAGVVARLGRERRRSND